MRFRKNPIHPAWPRRLWGSLFVVWCVFLSGLPAQWFGPPGAVQLLRVTSLYNSKIKEADLVEADIRRLENESDRLAKSSSAQEREIRRSLGYAAHDELIFDFSNEIKVTQRGRRLASVKK